MWRTWTIASRPLTGSVLIAAAAVAFLPAVAHAHAAFQDAVPEPGSRLETSPTRIALVFTEPLNHRLTRELVSHSWRQPMTFVSAARSQPVRVAQLYGVDWRVMPPVSIDSLPPRSRFSSSGVPPAITRPRSTIITRSQGSASSR